jgi:hypothetical protein
MRVGGNNPSKVGTMTCSRNDYFQSSTRSFLSVSRRTGWRPVCGRHRDLEGNPKLLQHLDSFFHKGQVGITSHHYPNDFSFHFSILVLLG